MNRVRCSACGRSFTAQRSTARTCSSACRQARSRKLRTTTPPLPPGPFSLIYADPPWDFQTFSAKGQGKHASRHYETMDLKAICDLPVADIAAEDCGLVIWDYGPLLPEVLQVIKAWGFTYRSELLVWVKITRSGKPAFGTGYTTRKGAEMALYAIRGKGLKVVDHSVRQCFFAELHGHSCKPDKAAESLERLFGPVPRIELFARRKRPGWASWGAELVP
jgi:N6-adenosine-specific RNA methylase IME4